MKIPPEFENATPDERIAFVQMLWDEIARNPGSVPLSDEHKAVLRERLRAYEEDGDSGEPWGVVRDRILADLRSR
jgi:putative addiction module component (TIGR02574 family)